MHVVATAGHVDHGKSTLVRALTGMEPDRLAEERRRGLTIELGFVWTRLTPDAEPIAFVDVPGHQRFLSTMLAGVGPVPAAMLVVAADGGWEAQTAEHVAALEALGVRHGLVAITRSDLADPASGARGGARPSGGHLVRWRCAGGGVRFRADRRRPRRAARRSAPGDGNAAPAAAFRTGTRVGRPDVHDRGCGNGRHRNARAGHARRRRRAGAGDGGRPSAVRVRGLQSLGQSESSVAAVARVAVNLRGLAVADVARGDALLTPGADRLAAVVDARVEKPSAPLRELPSDLILHVGAASVVAHVRPLDDRFARLSLERPLPLRRGDRGLLRDPGRQAVMAAVVVDDIDPPALVRRGAARSRAAELSRGLSIVLGGFSPRCGRAR